MSQIAAEAVELPDHEHVALPQDPQAEWLCADALVDAERRIEARIAPSGASPPEPEGRDAGRAPA